MALYVQYGCGLCVPEGWLNFDASPTMRLQKIPLLGAIVPGPRFSAGVKYGDITRGLPLADGSVDAVYCSHTLEHLALDDFRRALKNTFRVLRSGGIFRFVLPDLRSAAETYVATRSPEASLKFLEATLLGQASRPRGMKGFVRAWLGNADHRWMWDFESMENELRQAGFVSIRPAMMGDSGDAMFQRIEEPRRWEGQLGVHCNKA